MKALKRNSALYLEQITSAVAECYEKDEIQDSQNLSGAVSGGYDGRMCRN